MERKHYEFVYETYDSINELNEQDAALLREAQEATKLAYAPYSKFNVGAAARLVNGEIVRGSNQENASFPAGFCAERTLLSTAASIHPGVAIDTMAVSYQGSQVVSNKPISPCGVCRQTLAEFETRVNRPIRLILAGLEGKVFIIPQSTMLLPFTFSGKHLGSGE